MRLRDGVPIVSCNGRQGVAQIEQLRGRVRAVAGQQVDGVGLFFRFIQGMGVGAGGAGGIFHRALHHLFRHRAALQPRLGEEVQDIEREEL